MFSNSFGALSNQIGSSPVLLSLNLLLPHHEDNAFDALNQFPALLVNTQKKQHAFYTFYNSYNFAKVKNITLQNSATSGVNERKGNYNPNPKNQFMLSYQYSTPLSDHWYAKSLGFSFIAPIPELLIIDSTSSFLPKYYWYDSRLNRTEILFHVSQSLNNQWSSSVTLHSLWDIESQSEVTAGLQGGGAPSSGRIQGKIRPKLNPQLGFLWHAQNTKVHISVTPYSRQHLKNKVIGKAPLGGSSTVDYAFTMVSQNNFDPTEINLNGAFSLNYFSNILLGLSYQDWSHYQSNSLQIIDADGVVTNSHDYEQLEGKRIFSPALGFELGTMEHYLSHFSYRFRPKIFNKDNSLSGNTLDDDVHILGAGLKRSMQWVDNKVELSLGLQYHYMKKSSVEKTSLAEDGTSGHKVGAESYPMGGTFMVFAAGLNYNF